MSSLLASQAAKDLEGAPQMGQRQPTMVWVIRIPSAGQTGTRLEGFGASSGMVRWCMPRLSADQDGAPVRRIPAWPAVGGPP
jgi:hypothetical protein